MRFVPVVKQIASSVMFAVQPSLLELLSGEPELGEVINGWVREWPEHDAEIEVMELPYALRIAATDLPGPVPYLDIARIKRTSRWAPPKCELGPLRVGLVWRSSDWDNTRSLPADALSTLRDSGAMFYSLQQDVGPAELAELPIPVIPLSEGTRNPLDAAAAMLWLNVILTVDSMPAHLAGALGRSVWVILKPESDCRWMDERQDSPWYPTMKLYRQDGSWGRLVQEVASNLRELSGRI